MKLPEFSDELDSFGLAGVPVVGLGRPHQVVRRLRRQLGQVVQQRLVIGQTEKESFHLNLLIFVAVISVFKINW